MSFARDSYTAIAAQTDFTITFAYIDESHVEVYKDGTLQTVGAANDFTIVSGVTVRFNSGMAGGEVVILLRDTSQSARLVDYANASNLIEDDLDRDSLQAFYMAQEALDGGLNVSLQRDASDNWDALGARIVEVADPTSAQHAATKEYVDEQVIASGNVPSPSEAQDNFLLTATDASEFNWVALEVNQGQIEAAAIIQSHFEAEAVNTAALEDSAVTELVLADEAVTLTKLEHGTVGNLVTYGTDGEAEAVATGTVGQVLTSNGAGSVPTYQAASGNVRGTQEWSETLTGSTLTQTVAGLTFVRIRVKDAIVAAGGGNLTLELGVSAAYSTSGGGNGFVLGTAPSASIQNVSSGVVPLVTVMGTTAVNGTVTLWRENSGTDDWNIEWSFANPGSAQHNQGTGYITLSGSLTDVRLDLTSSTFSSGTWMGYGS